MNDYDTITETIIIAMMVVVVISVGWCAFEIGRLVINVMTGHDVNVLMAVSTFVVSAVGIGVVQYMLEDVNE